MHIFSQPVLCSVTFCTTALHSATVLHSVIYDPGGKFSAQSTPKYVTIFNGGDLLSDICCFIEFTCEVMNKHIQIRLTAGIHTVIVKYVIISINACLLTQNRKYLCSEFSGMINSQHRCYHLHHHSFSSFSLLNI